MIPVLHGVWAAAGGLVGDFEHIETITVGAGGATSVEFTSIPGTYKHLQIRILENKSGSGFNPIVQFNSDTNSNYSWHYLYGDGSTVSSSAGTSQTFMYVGSNANTTSTIFNAHVCDILNYANTSTYKTMRTLDGCDSNSGGTSIILWSGNWRSTSAITSIKFSNGTFGQYSTFALYGVK